VTTAAVVCVEYQCLRHIFSSEL